jgi:hypothetical protein
VTEARTRRALAAVLDGALPLVAGAAATHPAAAFVLRWETGSLQDLLLYLPILALSFLGGAAAAFVVEVPVAGRLGGTPSERLLGLRFAGEPSARDLGRRVLLRLVLLLATLRLASSLASVGPAPLETMAFVSLSVAGVAATGASGLFDRLSRVGIVRAGAAAPSDRSVPGAGAVR